MRYFVGKPTRRELLAIAGTGFLPTWAQQDKRDYDESKVRHYTLPDPLKLSNGRPVTSPSMWTRQRKPELLRLFAENIYGRAPGRTKSVRIEQTSFRSDALEGKARRKLVTIRFDRERPDPSMQLLIYLPREQRRTKLFLGINFRGNHTVTDEKDIPLTTKWVYANGRASVDHHATDAGRGMQKSQWPVEQILARGYGLATFYSGDLSPDWDGGFPEGIEPLFYRPGQTKRDPDEWGAIAAWAWGLSRAMDYLARDGDIDPHGVFVMGHSRMGKTALWAGASDPRFAMVISNCSGAGGATLARRRFGESVKDLNNHFPWWFCENYAKFSDNEDALPVDQHELIALSAPRPIYIAVAEQDLGSDPKGQFLSALSASPVYRLFGTDGLAVSEMPPVHQPVMSRIGFHMRAGKHDITPYDWDQYMNFADKYAGATDTR